MPPTSSRRSPALSRISHFDHQQLLGDTVEKIAAEKAGIIKPGIPVVTATDEQSALAVIEKMAREKNAPLVNSEFRIQNSESSITTFGRTPKIKRGARAGDGGSCCKSKSQLPAKKIRAGLANVNWPGRLQLIQKPNGQKFLLDGAHNVASAKALRDALEKIFSSKRANADSWQFLQDKDWREICEILSPLAGKFFTVPVASERSADPKELAEICRTANPAAGVFVCDPLKDALEKNGSRRRLPHQNFVVVTGSLYLVGEALELLGFSPAVENERALNEWSPKSATK